uniref:ASCH domain-containing protein n=1 Tax=Rhizochromulina marina TaxID=1034831 RepID=A0A7S2WU33_9STRA|mmetsp:Transcript_3719/g.10912  ORF Transcript_3719/g.10912 Transcript_3719/m.10912 type:complete len:142 (+) Transcript_3719:179-604(+)|eukprot:CAMPEP_0118973444 /NCGR_PEP_ID=MMETSP1173-20130426/10129_1 /TAXON_ID=1034831 /ORGANISM="Rhizochromulina marina cf, Strain CCMP1243" /LENGTH=141 /DNA_ID=CAMNT_0006923101 /DNA_START=176 /DNA_END=601 /DNA_ORIENTATION=-
MKVASGGKCKVCKEMFVSVRRLRPQSMGTELRPMDFAEELVSLVLSGAKTATTRLLRDEPSLANIFPGDRVRATCRSAGESALVVLRVQSRTETTLSQISDELAHVEGMENASELCDALRGFYPSLTEVDELTTFHFHVDQ